MRLTELSQGARLAELSALRDKYLRMRALRAEHEQEVASGARGHAPRDRLRALAREFPGALAELDRIEGPLLEARLASLDALISAEPGAATGDVRTVATWPTWVIGWIAVHRSLRGVLAIKAWLRGRRRLDDETRAGLARAIAAAPFAADAGRWLDQADLIAAPPGGRLVDLVLRRVASELGTTPEALRHELMPRPTRAPGADDPGRLQS